MRVTGSPVGYLRRRSPSKPRTRAATQSSAPVHIAASLRSVSGRIWTPGDFKRGPVQSLSDATSTTAAPAVGLFFPLDIQLHLRAEGYSPWVLERLEWAGGNLESFASGAGAIHKMLELEIGPAGLCAVTEKLGRERASLRDAEVQAFQNGDLKPQYVEAPAVAAVAMDGGRAQIRASGAPRGVHEPAWIETKVADLSTYSDVDFTVDPEPEVPKHFLDPPKVVKLVRQMKGFSGGAPAEERRRPVKTETQQDPEPARERTTARRKVRTVVATTGNCDQFGPMVAAEATRRSFFAAKKKAALGDGGAWIWGIVGFFLVGFTPILDFLHLLSHLYAAAQAAYKAQARKAWTLYVRLLKLAWSGQVEEVLETLKEHAERLGQPPAHCAEDDPRKVLWGTVDYVDKNKDKMDYPRYRREGLPITSAMVESLIKQVGRRVKGTEKFWDKERLEAVLQVRAAHLSDDGRAEAHSAKRPLGRAAGRSLFPRLAKGAA